MIRLRIEGGREVREQLASVSRAADARFMLALQEAGEIIRGSISSRAPRRSGRLASSIVVEREGQAKVIVKPRGTHYYAGTVEFGGIHRPRRQKTMAWREGESWIFAQRVRISGHPFFSPGYELAKDRALQRIERELDDWLK